MGDLIVKIIPFIIPALLIWSWLENNPTDFGKKKASGGDGDAAPVKKETKAPEKTSEPAAAKADDTNMQSM